MTACRLTSPAMPIAECTAIPDTDFAVGSGLTENGKGIWFSPPHRRAPHGLKWPCERAQADVLRRPALLFGVRAGSRQARLKTPNGRFPQREAIRSMISSTARRRRGYLPSYGAMTRLGSTAERDTT